MLNVMCNLNGIDFTWIVSLLFQKNAVLLNVKYPGKNFCLI